MTVEECLRAEIPGYPFVDYVLERAVFSPVFAKPKPMRAISLSDLVDDFADDAEFIKSLQYATSTLYYSAAGAFSGGSSSEQVGDISASQSGFKITQCDRDYYRSKANDLRRDIGAAVEEIQPDSGGAFDASNRRKRTPNCRGSWS